jgi:hypothetical protein
MKTRSTRSLRRLPFKIRFFCDYAEQIGQLETALARKPEKLELDIMGSGELSPDTALLMRAVRAVALKAVRDTLDRPPVRSRWTPAGLTFGLSGGTVRQNEINSASQFAAGAG